MKLLDWMKKNPKNDAITGMNDEANKDYIAEVMEGIKKDDEEAFHRHFNIQDDVKQALKLSAQAVRVRTLLSVILETLPPKPDEKNMYQHLADACSKLFLDSRQAENFLDQHWKDQEANGQQPNI